MSSNNKLLSKNAQRVQEVLQNKGLSCEVVELSATTRTAKDAAIAIGCDAAQIVKSLLFRTAKTERPIFILASGINQVNEKTIEKFVGETIVKADADFTRDITGFAIGGVPPLGHAQLINHIYIDEDLLQYETLWAAAGTPFAVFNFYSSNIQALTGGKIVSIK